MLMLICHRSIEKYIRNQSPGQYLTGANNDILVIVQIETKEAVENLEEIASVDGIGRA
jgi:2-keto-3-deoxy-L-rhamnonate aldolase RhmA